jgi:hypothetical protein
VPIDLQQQSLLLLLDRRAVSHVDLATHCNDGILHHRCELLPS